MRYFKKILLLITVSCIFLLYPRKIATAVPLVTQESPQKMPAGYLFSVAVNHQVHCLAKKIGKGTFELLYINKYMPLHVNDPVYTTGLDQQFPEDILIGYVNSIDQEPNSLYSTVVVKRSSEL